MKLCLGLAQSRSGRLEIQPIAASQLQGKRRKELSRSTDRSLQPLAGLLLMRLRAHPDQPGLTCGESIHARSNKTIVRNQSSEIISSGIRRTDCPTVRRPKKQEAYSISMQANLRLKIGSRSMHCALRYSTFRLHGSARNRAVKMLEAGMSPSRRS